MAIIKSGASSDQLTVDATSKAGRTTLYDTAGRALGFQAKATFFAAASFTPVATPNELVIIYGSASKTVRVMSMRIGTANTATGSQIYHLIKRSAIYTGGVFVPATAVPADSTDAATATNFGHFSTDPTPGAAVGTINTIKTASPAVTPATWAGITDYAQWEMIPMSDSGLGLLKPIVLNGVNQGLAINFNDVALVAGQVHHYNIVWTEE